MPGFAGCIGISLGSDSKPAGLLSEEDLYEMTEGRLGKGPDGQVGTQMEGLMHHIAGMVGRQAQGPSLQSVRLPGSSVPITVGQPISVRNLGDFLQAVSGSMSRAAGSPGGTSDDSDEDSGDDEKQRGGITGQKQDGELWKAPRDSTQAKVPADSTQQQVPADNAQQRVPADSVRHKIAQDCERLKVPDKRSVKDAAAVKRLLVDCTLVAASTVSSKANKGSGGRAHSLATVVRREDGCLRLALNFPMCNVVCNASSSSK